MFGINKNGTKHKIGIVMPSFFPASRTSYSNSASGLTATNAQDAIDELAQNDSWKLLQAVNGNTSISLPAQWSDLQIIAYQSTNIFDFNISHVAADYYHTNIDSRMMLAGGRYATSSAYNSILIDLHESSINIRSSYRNGSDDLANSKLIVFYK